MDLEILLPSHFFFLSSLGYQSPRKDGCLPSVLVSGKKRNRTESPGQCVFLVLLFLWLCDLRLLMWLPQFSRKVSITVARLQSSWNLIGPAWLWIPPNSFLWIPKAVQILDYASCLVTRNPSQPLRGYTFLLQQSINGEGIVGHCAQKGVEKLPDTWDMNLLSSHEDEQ